MSIRPFCIFSDATVIAILETMQSRQMDAGTANPLLVLHQQLSRLLPDKPLHFQAERSHGDGGRRRAVAADHFVNGAFLLGKPVIDGLLIGGLGLNLSYELSVF
jgi:hypothetical protein